MRGCCLRGPLVALFMSARTAITVEEFVEVVRSIPDASRSIGDSIPTSRTKVEIGEGLPLISGEAEDYSHGDFGGWGRELDEAVKARGTDALAYYVSFHDIDRYNKGNWGIFIKESGVRYLAAKFQASFPPKGLRIEGTQRPVSQLPWSEAVTHAHQALLFHELFHFATDCMVTGWESLLRTPCWGVHADRVQSVSPGYDPLEEALANAYMYKQCQKGHIRGLRRWLKLLIANSPQGYNEALEYVGEDSFPRGLDELSRRYVALPMSSAGLATSGCVIELHKLFELDADRCLDLCPVHIVRDAKSFAMPPLGLSFITCLPSVTLTSRFNRMLKKCPYPIQDEWQEFFRTCSFHIPRPPKFKKFKSVYALWLGGTKGGYRAHLRPIGGFKNWEALEVGTHLEMGHGK